MQKHRVSVSINHWDDPNGLIKILTNDDFYDYIDTFFVIDGRYKNREDMPEFRTDYVDDLASIYRKIHLVRMFDAIQIEKRNRYWSLAEEHNLDYNIVLDSDEYCTIEPDVFESSLRTCDEREEQCFPVQQFQQDIMAMYRPRLFKKPFNFRHRLNEGNGISHGSLWSDYGKGDKEIIGQMYGWFKDHEKRDKNGNQLGVPGITMYHDKEFRSRERVIRDRIYYDKDPKR